MSCQDDKEDGKKCLEDEDEGDGLNPRHPAAPDGGWGWLVVLSSFLCNLIVDGVCISFGLVASEYQRVFNSSHAMVGWVGSSLAGGYLLVGPFVSAMCARWGCRKVTIMGSIITMGGFALSTQSKNVEMLIITFGIIGGIGFGMIYLPSIVCVGHWFDKKRAFTTGIAVCGTAVGQFVFPPLVNFLLHEYGWEGMHLILAGLILNCAVCGMTFLPLDRRFFKNSFKRVKSRVEIERGAIMKALIEDKKRQRTISNGSLDNCIITKDNKLIKLDPAIAECKRNNSFIARFKRQLGFSSQSLACSKNSLQKVPNIVIDAVQKDLIRSSGSPIYKPNGYKMHESHSQSQLLLKNNFLNGFNMGSSPAQIPNGHMVTSGDNSLPPSAALKSSSCDSVLKDDPALLGQSQDEGIIFTVKQILGMPSTTVSATDLNSSSIPSPYMQGGVIKIQVIENGKVNGKINKNVRYRSGVSLATGYSSQGSTNSGYISDMSVSAQQMHASLDEAEYEWNSRHSIFYKYYEVICEMFDIKLMLNPIFALLVVSTFLTLLAFYTPFFYLAEKGNTVGFNKNSAPFLLALIGITNAIGRILCGWVADRPWADTLHLNNGALIIAGVVLLLCPFCNTEATVAAVAAIFGLSIAVFVSLRSILLVELLGLEMLTKSFGLLMLFQGVASFIGAPIAGNLYDSTGDINNCFYLAGGLTILSGLLMLPITYMRRPKQDKVLPLMPRDTPINEILRMEQL